LTRFREEVTSGEFPDAGHTVNMKPEELEQFMREIETRAS